MSGIIDFHSHILPQMDDGSSSVEESIAMLQMEAAQGITKVIATPHFYPHRDTPETFLTRRQASLERLQEAMGAYEGLPEIICGAEVYFFSGISDSEAIPQLTIGEKQYILIEMPQPVWSASMYAELEEIWNKWRITPIIAHVDRYLSPFRTYGIPERLEQLPVLVQANAGFFLRGSSRGRALRMLERDQIQLLGSDCHNMTSRLPNLDGARQMIEKHLSQETLSRICSYQEQVLDGR